MRFSRGVRFVFIVAEKPHPLVGRGNALLFQL
jgi:hypothetical protein